MWRYVLKRCLALIFVFIAAAFVIFTILYFTPGDPAQYLLGDDATALEREICRESLGLNDPYLVQLGKFYLQLFQGDLGTSWTYNVPVLQELLTRLPRTVTINLAAMILNVVVGVLLGICAAKNAGKWQDSTILVTTMVLISAPGFWVMLLLIILFSVKLGWLPSFGIGSWQHYVLPVIGSTLCGIANNARQMRSSILGVVRADFITTARAKGQSEKVITRKHMLPNAMMPVITVLGGALAGVVAGSAITESVFSIPGVGMYLINGISARDYPIVRGCVVFFALFTSVVMLITDLAYAFIDPRIKAQYEKKV